MSRHINSTRLIRTYNASTVLQTLYKHGSCSRSQLADLTKLSPATITRIIAELMEQGVVLEGDMGKSTGGRRPVYVHIDHTKLYIASVKLLRDDSIVAVLNLKGELLRQKHLKPHSLAPDELLTDVVTSLECILDSLSINRQHIIGVGVAISGICNPEGGTVVRSVNLGWENVGISTFLSTSLELPIFIENDANACAMAELWLGNAKDTTNSMYIRTESGAGAGIISKNTLLTGPRFTTGEIGHIPLIVDGEDCRCGQKGCLETYVYFGDIQARYQKKTGATIDHHTLVQLAREKDDYASKILKDAASALALACAHWGILLDLDVITIGGFWGDLDVVITHCQDYYRNILQQSGLPHHTVIAGSGFREDAALLGAAGLVINHWFSPFAVPFDK